MAVDFGPLGSHDTQRVYDTIQSLAQQGISDQDILNFLSQSRQVGRSALEQYMNAAGMNIASGFQPQFDQARNTLGANPLLAQSGYANRLNRQLLTDLAARESGAFNTAAADQAQSQVGYLQGLRGQQVGLRSNLAQQSLDTILKPPKKPSKFGPAVQAIGAATGAYANPSQPQGGGYQRAAPLGSSGGMAPGFQNYQSQYYGSPPGGYSESLGGPRRGRYPWQ